MKAKFPRRDFLKFSLLSIGGAFLASCGRLFKATPKVSPTLAITPSKTVPPPSTITSTPAPAEPVVSIVKIKDGDIQAAVEEAIDLIGGIKTVASGKERIMLKPNLVMNNTNCTTKPEVVRSLAALMKKAGKVVTIGEGSAVVDGYNVANGTACILSDPLKLNAMQHFVFDSLGYTELAKSLDVQLVNLNTGEMVEVDVPGGGLAYNQLTLHKSLTEIDLLCSVPMMKTHNLAWVTLGMKNLIGLYPGSVYGTVRSGVHDYAAAKGSPGLAFEVIDMVRANKLGLVVIDGSTAMEGDGPDNGKLLQMDVIIAGTNPLATDMVAANVMGFTPDEIPNKIPTFVCANSVGMQPQSLDEIKVVGVPVSSVQRNFARPNVQPWNGSVYKKCISQL